MEMKFSIQGPNLNNSKNQTVEGMKKVLWKAMTKMEEIAKLKAPVDTGNLKNRIHLTPLQFGAKEYTLSDGVEYGVYVEYGTKPHYVPITPLIGWAGRVLGDKSAAFAVRAKISKFGTPAQPFFRPALHEVQYKWLKIYRNEVFGKVNAST